MEYDILLILTIILIGILEIIVGLPLLFGKIKPNWIYGFRLPKTLSSDEIWYKSNRYVGRDFVITGIVVTLGSLFLYIFRFSFSIIEITWIGVSLLIIPLIVVLIRGVIYLKQQMER